jgi:hypothetical protein
MKTWLAKQLEIPFAENVFVASNQHNANGTIDESNAADSQEIVVITCDTDSKILNE